MSEKKNSENFFSKRCFCGNISPQGKCGDACVDKRTGILRTCVCWVDYFQKIFFPIFEIQFSPPACSNILINSIGVDNYINSNGIDRKFVASRWTFLFWAFNFNGYIRYVFIIRRHRCQHLDTGIYLYAIFVLWNRSHQELVLREPVQFRHLILLYYCLRHCIELFNCFWTILVTPNHCITDMYTTVFKVGPPREANSY